MKKANRQKPNAFALRLVQLLEFKISKNAPRITLAEIAIGPLLDSVELLLPLFNDIQLKVLNTITSLFQSLRKEMKSIDAKEERKKQLMLCLLGEMELNFGLLVKKMNVHNLFEITVTGLCSQFTNQTG